VSTDTAAAYAELLADIATLRKFVPPAQMSLMLSLMVGAEGGFYREKIQSLAAKVRSMPVTSETGDDVDPIIHLHYFRGPADVWILERDVGDGKASRGLGAQHQAFGYVDLGYGPELGYVSLPEIFSAGMELDLHWKPTPVSAALKGHIASEVA
jgi:hypothetical protein